MSVASRVARGASALMVGQLARLAAKGTILYLLAGTFLTPDKFGLLFYVISILGLGVLLASLGFAKSAARYIAEFRERDPSQIPHILSATLLYNLVGVVAVGVGLVLFHERIAELLGEPTIAPLLLLGAGYVAARSLAKGATLCFQGFNRVDIGAVLGIVSNVSLLGFIVAFLVLGWGLAGAMLGYTAGYALAAVVGIGWLYVRFYRPNDAGASVEPGLHRRLLEYSVPLAATRGANVLDNRVDTILVGYLINPTAVAYYTLGKQISEFVVAPANSLGVAVSPTYGEKKANEAFDEAARIYETTFEYTLALYLPATVGVFLVAGPAIRLVFGEGYLGAVPVLQVLSVFVLVKALDKITSDGLDYLGRARARALAKSGASISNFFLNLLLIPILGAAGAAIATVVTHSGMLAVELVVVYRELELSAGRLLRALGSVGAITAGMSLAVVPLVGYISGIASLVAVVGVGVVVWAALAVTSGVVDVRQLRAVLS